jgi:hypothetical protein
MLIAELGEKAVNNWTRKICKIGSQHRKQLFSSLCHEIARKWKDAIPFQLYTMYLLHNPNIFPFMYCKIKMSTRPISIIRSLGHKKFLEEGLRQFLCIRYGTVLTQLYLYQFI